MSNYATIKGCSIKPYRIEPGKVRAPRMQLTKYGVRDKTFQQRVFIRREEYVFLPAKTYRTLRGESHTSAPVFRSRPVYRIITHKAAA